jgi:putative tryptophan/tyrosine transport system substrate-binding protein
MLRLWLEAGMQFDQLKRRELITLLAAAATFPASWPIAAKAQPRARIPTIGFLGSGTPSSDGAFATAFVRGLRELGWVEGRDVAIEYRWGEARVDRFAELATEFAQLKVDVIFTYGTATASLFSLFSFAIFLDSTKRIFPDAGVP